MRGIAGLKLAHGQTGGQAIRRFHSLAQIGFYLRTSAESADEK
jgi:hypothetical protein